MLFAILLLAELAFHVLSNPLVRRAPDPIVSNTQDLGYATDPGFNPSTYRDGGGGACVRGMCVIGFSDSFTTHGGQFFADVKSVSSQGFSSFVHNSFVLFDPKGGNAPTLLSDYGNRQAQDGLFTDPVLGPYTDSEKNDNLFAIWPNSNMIPLDVAGIDLPALVGVANALDENSNTLYNTMYAVEVKDEKPDGKVLSAVRLAPQLFTASENLYGTFCVTRGHDDLFIYLLSSTISEPFGPSHLKVARVPANLASVKAAYTYWDGKLWSPLQPSRTDATGSIYDANARLDTGELYWSEYHAAWLLITSSFGEFRVAKAKTNDFTQGFGPSSIIYTAKLPAANQADPIRVVYSGHAYPDWDPTHKSLLLSWALDVNWVQMAIVNWA